MHARMNVRRLGMALVMHARRHGNRFPADLAALHRGDRPGFFDPAMVTRERRDSAPERLSGRALANWIERNSDYVYVGANQELPRLSRRGQRRVILYEKPGLNGGEGTHMFFSDRDVEFVPWPEARRILRDSGAEVPDDLPGG